MLHRNKRGVAAIVVAVAMAVPVTAATTAASPATIKTTSANPPVIPPPSSASSRLSAQNGTATGTEISTSSIPSNQPAPGARPSQSHRPSDIPNPDAGLRLSQPTPQAVPVPANRTATTVTPALASTVGTQVTGLNQSTTGGAWPGDVSAAVGSTGDMVETTNLSNWSIYDKFTGGQLYTSTLQSWWGLPSSAFLTDPHVTFDPLGSRYATVVDDGSNWLLSVAEQAQATGKWCKVSIPAITAAGQFADFPEIGVDQNDIYLTMVDYASKSSSNQVDSVVVAIPKGGMESGGCKNLSYKMWTKVRDPGTACLLCSNDQLAFRIAPATAYESLSTYGWLADAYGGGGAHITAFHVDYPKGDLWSNQISTPSYSPPPSAPQPGTTSVLDTGNTDIVNITKNGGLLYLTVPTKTSWSGAADTAGILWLQVTASDASGPSLSKSGSFGNSAAAFFYPSTAGGSSANTYQAVNYEISSSTINPSSAVITLDNTGAITSNLYTAQGNAAYTGGGLESSGCSSTPCYRWGDYTSILNDPSNQAVFWGTGETATTNAGSSIWASEMTAVTVS